MNRKTEITIETHSITIIHVKGNSQSAYCEQCRKTVTGFAPEQVARFFQKKLAEICRQIQTEQIHLTQTKRGTALVCGSFFQNSNYLTELQNKTEGER